MNRVTPDRIESEIRRLTREAEERRAELPKLYRAAAEADAAYRISYAKALLRAEGPVAIREAQATADTGDLLWERKVSQSIADAARDAAQLLKSQLLGVQSVGAMIRSEMDLQR